MTRPAIAFALVLALPSLALAGNALAPEKVEVYPNFNAASVYAYFTGDDNRNATATLLYRAGDEKEFHEGPPLSRTGPGRFAGSVFWLQPDQPLEVRVTFADPDGVTPAEPLLAKTRTRSDKFPTGSGKTYYVGPGGDDAAAGTRDKPFKTVQHAVGLAAPGDTVLLMDGAYAESVTVKRSGRPDAYITLRPDPEDTAPPIRYETEDRGHAEKRFVARPRLVGWVHPEGGWENLPGNLYAAPEKRPVGTVTMSLPYPADDSRPVGTRIYHHESLEELKGAEAGLLPGWWQDAKAGRLYVRLTPQDGRSVTAYVVRLGVLRCGLQFDKAGYWIVEDLTFEVFGGGPYSHGIDIVDSPNVVVRRCTFDTMRVGVAVRKAGSRDCLVEHCRFHDSGIWTWPWKSVKAHDTEGGAVDLIGGPGNVVRFCDVRGPFNGVGASTWGDLGNEALNRDLDVHDNRFLEIGDDPMEPEGACMNNRFWNNVTHDTLQGISLAPITVGPTWVVRDRYYQYKGGAFKASVDSKGFVYIYHCLGWTDRPAQNACDPSGPYGNFHFRNTILRGTRYAYEDMVPHLAPNSLDYCDFFTTDPKRFIKWLNRTYPNLAALVAAEPEFGRHNLAVEPYATLERGLPDALAPALIDAGVRIPGINDGFKGKAPDIGPEEN